MSDPLGLLNTSSAASSDPLGLLAKQPEPPDAPQTMESALRVKDTAESFSEWWNGFLAKPQAERAKDIYSIAQSNRTGLPPSMISEQTPSLPDKWAEQIAPTLISTVRQILEIPKSLGEVGLSFAIGSAGWLVSSGLGIAEATKPGSTRESVRATIEASARRLTFTPETQPAKVFLDKAGRLIEAVTKPAREAAALVGESWDSPFLEAVLGFAGEAAIFKLIGQGAEKIQKLPEWYYRLTVQERGLVEGIKKDIMEGDLTPQDVRELWQDPANRDALRKRYAGGEAEPGIETKIEGAPEQPAPATEKAAGEISTVETGKVSPAGEIATPMPESVFHGGAGVDSLTKKFSILTPEEKQKLPSSNVGLTGLSMTTDKEVALEYSRNIGGTDKVFEAKINPKAKIYEIDTEGDGIDDFLTDDQINQIKADGFDAIRDISEGAEKEFRALTENAITSSAITSEPRVDNIPPETSTGGGVRLYTGQPRGVSIFNISSRSELPKGGIFLTDSPDVAKIYAGKHRIFYRQKGASVRGGG